MSVVNVLSEKLNVLHYREKLALLKRLLIGTWAQPVNVNLTMPECSIEPGGQLLGEVRVKGGGRSAVIDQVVVAVILDYDITLQGVTKSANKRLISTVVANRTFLGPNSSELVLPFLIQIPHAMPNTCGKTRCVLKASLEQSGCETVSAVKVISIAPNCVTRYLFEAVDSLGFSVLPDSGEYINRYQRFKFKPTEYGSERLSELTLFLMTSERDLNLMIEVRTKTNRTGTMQPPAKFNLPYTGIRNSAQIRSMLMRLLAEVS